MFELAKMLYLYTETPLHAGSGTSVGVVDLPIQRERITHYPLVQATGIKGKLRSEAYERTAAQSEFIKNKDALTQKFLKEKKPEDEEQERFASRCERRAHREAIKESGLEAVFGPDSDEADLHAGAISPGDARLLLFPVRSLIGVFAWTTSRNVLARFLRDLKAVQPAAVLPWSVDTLTDNDKIAWTVDDKSVVANNKVVLEEFAFDAQQHADVGEIAKWLGKNAFPQSPEYTYFCEQILTKLVILPEDAFRDFTQFATEVVTRVRIDPEKRTVAKGALWTEEHLPSDTLLYSPLHIGRPRASHNTLKTAQDVSKFLVDLKLERIQLGGDETVGRGIVHIHFGG